jgi:hypothetical protein
MQGTVCGVDYVQMPEILSVGFELVISCLPLLIAKRLASIPNEPELVQKLYAVLPEIILVVFVRKFYKSAGTLIVRSGPLQGLTQYPPRASTRRCQSFPKSLGQSIPTLPRDSVPIDPPKQDRRQWQVPISAGIDAVAPIPPAPSPITFAERISALNPSLQLLLDNVVILLPLPKIAALFATSPLLTRVGYGQSLH